jgi:hypothetical protein
MIKIVNENWEKILKKPNMYVDDDQDIVLVKIVPVSSPNNATLLIVGKDVLDGRYYVVIEDNETSEDVYLEGKETLYNKFMEIYKDLSRKDELLAILHEASVNANVAPEFHGDNGTTIELTQPVIDMINNILEQAYLPYIANVVIDNGYRKKGDK